MKRRSFVAATAALTAGTAGCSCLGAVIGGESDDPSVTWSYDHGGRIHTVARGLVVGRQETDDQDSLFALTTDTGDRAWTFGSLGAGRTYLPTQAYETGFYTSTVSEYQNSPQSLYALDFDGTVRWDGQGVVAAHGSEYLYAVVDQYEAGPSRRVVALDPETGDRAWTTDEGDSFSVELRSGSDDERLHVGTTWGDGGGWSLLTLDGETGDRLRQYDLATANVWRELDHEDTRYLSTDDSVVAVDLRYGAEHWRVSNLDRPRLIAVESDLVYVRTAQGTVLALDAEDGSSAWTRTTDATGTRVLNGRVLLTGDDEFVALDAQTGRTSWRFGGDPGNPTLAEYIEDTAYVSTDRLHALSIDDGTERWSVELDETVEQPIVRSIGWNESSQTPGFAVQTGASTLMYLDSDGNPTGSSSFDDEVQDVEWGDRLLVGTEGGMYAMDLA